MPETRMEPDTRYTLVGASLLALIAAAVLAFVWLSNIGSAADYRRYSIYFARQSLEGLQIGGDVNMRGVNVGRVENYQIRRENINSVKVTIRVARRTPVSTNTRAVVARNLVTGIARINLETSGVPGPELVEAPTDEDFPVIPEGLSNLDQMTETAANLAQSAQIVLANANKLLTEDNRKAFSQTLLGLRELTRGLNRQLDAFAATAASIQSSAVAIEQSSRQVGAAAEKFGDGMVPLTQQAQATLKEMQTVLQEFAKTSRSIERDAAKLALRADDTADVGMLELRATAQELRSSAELLARTLDRLHDPRAALVGPRATQVGPGEAVK
jgi:hypothetical protein